jgi:hypothetical protein
MWQRASFVMPMLRRILVLRILLALAYAVIVFTTAHYQIDSLFCKPPYGSGFVAPLIKLTIVIALCDSILSAACAYVLMYQPKITSGGKSFTAGAVASAIFIGIVIWYLPEWLYLGYGDFRFKNTWADLSCLYANEAGGIFVYLGCFILGFITFVREVLAQTVQLKWKKIENAAY